MTEYEAEYEILDIIYESLDDHAVSLYENGVSKPELYIQINGECWQINATRHPHEGELR